MLHFKGNTVQERFVSAVRQLKIKFPGSTIANRTGYKKATVSEYLKKKPPSEAFIRTFSEKFEVDFEAIWLGTPEDATMGVAPKDQRDERFFTASQLFAMFLEVSGKQTAILENIETKMAQEQTQALIKKSVEKIEANLPALLNRQDSGFGIVIELLKRDVLREAKGNQEKANEILAEIVRRIGPDLSPKMKTSIRADGHN